MKMTLNELPDGTDIPATAIYTNGIVIDWTGLKCNRCEDGFETVCLDDLRDYSIIITCRGCGGTGEYHGPVWQWEE